MTQSEHAVFLDRWSLDRRDLDLSALKAAAPGLRCFDQTRADERLERLEGVRIAITNKVVIDRSILEACPSLTLIAVAATGVNNVDVEAAHEHGVTVINCRGYGTNSVAQHALGLLLNLLTAQSAYLADTAAGRWSNSPFFCLMDHPIREAAGKVVGLVGYGTLGGRFAELCQALGMEVRISQRPGAPNDPGSERIPFNELVEQVDVLSLHCPLTPETERLINADVLRRMKSDAVLINTARGGLVDEPALIQALQQGEIAGAGLDVVSEEPPPVDHALMSAWQRGEVPNLLITPHSAWASIEARQRVVDQLAEGITAFENGAPIRTV